MATLGALVLLAGLLGWNPSVVQSESMEPNVSTGDVVLAAALPDSSPLPIGGVITFHVEGRDVVHRIVTVNEDNSIVTAGDANYDFDPWSITREDITGQARLLVPYVGLPGMWAQRGEYLPLAAWLAVTVTALFFAAPARPSRPRPPRAGAHSVTQRRTRTLLGASAAVAGVVAMTVAMAPLPSVDAAFTGTTRTASTWTAKSYPALTVGALSGYGALAASAVRDPAPHIYRSTVQGDVGTTPGTTVTGFRNKDVASVNLDNESARNAMAAAHALRSALEQRPLTRTIPATLGGTLTSGVYASTTGAFSVPGTLTLDARGDPNARFIFRTASTLTMAQRSRVALVNGAQAANVYWIVGSSARLGSSVTWAPDTVAVGTYLVAGEVTLQGIVLNGRAVSFGGSVSLNGRIAPAD
jgi:signal peptidase I